MWCDFSVLAKDSGDQMIYYDVFFFNLQFYLGEEVEFINGFMFLYVGFIGCFMSFYFFFF